MSRSKGPETQGTPAGRTTARLPRTACTLVPGCWLDDEQTHTKNVQSETRTLALTNISENFSLLQL